MFSESKRVKMLSVGDVLVEKMLSVGDGKRKSWLRKCQVLQLASTLARIVWREKMLSVEGRYRKC